MQMLVNIDVDDLERAIAFYQAALPLRVVRRLFDGSVAELEGASSRLFLLTQPSGSVAAGDARRDYRRHWTPVHIDFVTEDVETALQRALDAGAIQETPVREFSWGRLVTLADPFGHGFCLLQFHAGGYAGQ